VYKFHSHLIAWLPFHRHEFVLFSNIWYDHFRNVFSPSTYSDQGRQDEISERVSTIRTLVKERIRDDEMVIKLSDVSEICTRLKNHKACGHDNISYEHIKYGGKLLIKHLCYLFNLFVMLGTREIPRYEFVSVLGLLSPLYNKLMMLFLQSFEIYTYCSDKLNR
jgi:hypothetical protein